jgi:hypothetical protein
VEPEPQEPQLFAVAEPEPVYTTAPNPVPVSDVDPGPTLKHEKESKNRGQLSGK